MGVRMLGAGWIAAATACGLLAGCGPDQSSQTDGDAQVALAGNPLPSYSPVQGQPPSEVSFEQQLIGRYLSDQNQYDNQPNDLSKHQFQDTSDKNLCSLVRSHTPFKNWTGTITQIDQPNVTVLFTIDIGNGFKLQNDTMHDLSLDSPAYKVISKLHVGDQVTVSGDISVDGIVGTCDDYPTWSLSDHKIGTGVFNVTLSELNGASASAPPQSDGPAEG